MQIIDLPGIIEGAKDGRGRGRQVIAVAKTCHLIFIILDVNKPLTDKRVIEQELEGFGIRINKEPPNIIFKKKEKGGLNITSSVPLTHIDNDEIRAVMSEYRINSADITIRCDATVDDLIDVLEAKSRRCGTAQTSLCGDLDADQLKQLYSRGVLPQQDRRHHH